MKIHTVKKGDTLWQIAKTHNVTLDELMDANPQITNPNQIYIGDKIFIPRRGTRPQPPTQCPSGCVPVRPQPRTETSTAAAALDYETSDYAAMPVSSKYYTYQTPSAEKEEHYYTDKYQAKRSTKCPEGYYYHCHCHEYEDNADDNWECSQSKPFVYTVQKGDTLYKIAKANGFTVEQLLAANPHLSEDKVIYPGDKVFIPSRNMMAQIPMPLMAEDDMELSDYYETEKFYFICPHCGYKVRK